MVIDCTEIHTERPSRLNARKGLWSNYKHHSTLKALIGISPNGSINFLFRVLGGRASDKKVACDACINKLKAGLAVMADRGFVVEEAVAARVARAPYTCLLRFKAITAYWKRSHTD